MTGRIVDSHLHLWDLGAGGYAWLGPEHRALYRGFTADEAHAELRTAGISDALLVQADDCEADTRFMLGVADNHPFVAGVVGWVQLDDTAAVLRQLAGYGTHPAFRGVRHLVHDDPRDDFLDLPAVRRSLGVLAEHHLTFDVPDAWPRHLGQLPALADALPELTIVVDHLGKPPRGDDDLDAWAAALRELALRPNIVAKVSGLQRTCQPFTKGALRQVWDFALEVFGPSRLMYGSDWPMTVPDGGYQPHWRVMSALIGELTTDERHQVLAGTAASVYGIGAGDGPT